MRSILGCCYAGNWRLVRETQFFPELMRRKRWRSARCIREGVLQPSGYEMQRLTSGVRGASGRERCGLPAMRCSV
ncbi:hypothetical protein AALC16_09740 [Lachnospiraceae bacterium 29-91]